MNERVSDAYASALATRLTLRLRLRLLLRLNLTFVDEMAPLGRALLALENTKRLFKVEGRDGVGGEGRWRCEGVAETFRGGVTNKVSCVRRRKQP